jgi:hypothetical protein
MLFDYQYTLTETVTTETRTRTVTNDDGETETEEYTYYICTVTLENFNLSHVPVYTLTEDQLSMYAMYMATLGNRPDLFPDSEYVGKYTGGTEIDYEIPPEALEDEQFAAMMAEATKYIGYPYEAGGRFLFSRCYRTWEKTTKAFILLRSKGSNTKCGISKGNRVHCIDLQGGGSLCRYSAGFGHVQCPVPTLYYE